MKVSKCQLDGVLLIDPKIYIDDRGFFLESFEKKRYSEVGIIEDFIQDNHSRSKKNVLRGLHFNKNKPQAQIVTVIRGSIFDVVIDIRKESPTYGEWFGTELNDKGTRQIYMPHGFAHGFCVLSDMVDLHYSVSQVFNPEDDGGILWNDRSLDIRWPIMDPIVSLKDQNNSTLEDL